MKCTGCSNEVRPIVAVDIDGTMADYHGHFIRYACDYLALTSYSFPPTQFDGSTDLATFLGISKEKYREVKLAYRMGGGKRTQPPLGYPAALMRKLRALGVEIWVTTTRPYLRLDSTDPDTRFWLDRHGIEYDHLLYDEDKYAKLCAIVEPERIVAIVDDLPEMYDRADHLGLSPILRRSRYNRAHSRPVQLGDLQDVAYYLKTIVGNWKEAHA